MAFPTAPKPKSLLGYHRQLAPSAAVRVSPLCLGGMSFGTAWADVMGSCDKKSTYELLDFFKDQGGNFIDTASNYQNEESEAWIGDWMQERGNRDEMVLATKFTTAYQAYKGYDKIIQSNFGGTGAKGMKHSVEASLKKLKTDYIDLLWMHWWDYTTSIPELMHALNDLVVNGKVIYLGVSDTPAW
jgi:aryl-alcohol dehydrogenase-like predicted oxidoreductase